MSLFYCFEPGGRGEGGGEEVVEEQEHRERGGFSVCEALPGQEVAGINHFLWKIHTS